MELQRTLVIIKPDGVRRGLSGEIIRRFENVRMKIVGLKMVQVNEGFVGKHYKDDTDWYKSVGDKMLKFYKEHNVNVVSMFGTDNSVELGKKVRQWLLSYLSEGPVIAMVLQGYHAVEIVRKLVGDTYPLVAAPGTIRGDYDYDSTLLANTGGRAVRNMIHASGSLEDAEFEINLWFDKSEIFSEYKRVDED